MKANILLSAVLIFLFAFSFAPTCDAQWAFSYDTIFGGGDSRSQFLQTNGGDFVLTGVRGEYAESRFSILKLGPNGNIIWHKDYGEGGEGGGDIKQTSDGGYITYTNNRNGTSFSVLKITAAGEISWQKRYVFETGNEGSYAHSLDLSEDGSCVIAGSFSGLSRDAFVMKIDSNGAILWKKTYGGSNADWANAVISTADAGCLVAGVSYSFRSGADDNDFWVLKLNSSGGIEWQKNYGRPTISETAMAVHGTNDNGYIIIGTFYDDAAVGPGIWVIKLTSSGSMAWQGEYRGNWGLDIKQTTDGGFILSGSALICKLNSSGTVAWSREIDLSSFGRTIGKGPSTVIQTTNEDFVWCGGFSRKVGDQSYAPDTVILRMDKNGSMGVCDSHINNESAGIFGTATLATSQDSTVSPQDLPLSSLNDTRIATDETVARVTLCNSLDYIDTDSDGISDAIEISTCTSLYDKDSDDDGLPDGIEDANHNGVVDNGETNPCNVDTDGDGIQDGTELGKTTGVADPDGDGPLLGTNMALFIPDADPTTRTDPLDADTDGDGILDGEEDTNHNGRVDIGERNPNRSKALPWLPLLLGD